LWGLETTDGGAPVRRESPGVGTVFALLACGTISSPTMIAFILRRLIQAVIVMIAVAFFAFMLFQYVGDPVVFLLGQDAKPDQIAQLRADLGLDQPFFIQFAHFLTNAVQGEFGLSLRQGAKVSRLIAERFPATLELSLVAAVLALVVGVPHGGVRRSQTGNAGQPVVHDPVPAGRFLAHLFDRNPADSFLLGDAGLVPQLWTG
jgi:hypothetical protein